MTDRSDDEMFRRACEFAVQHNTISTSRIQLRFKVGYHTASRWLDRMVKNGVISMPNSHLH